MARLKTRTKVHDAVLALTLDGRAGALTMEGIAERAGVSKQTLYTSWPSTGAILFDALLARSTNSDGGISVPDTGDLQADLTLLATATVAELTDPLQDKLLRAVTAEIQTNDALAEQYRELLLTPQLAAIAARLKRGGRADAEDVAELFLGPILHRWLLRTRSFDEEWIDNHVARVIAVTN